ncbi:hypothetical protein Phab24_id132 [Acinetobacter phage Phab24]|nr:hypothetical protein Phab24_id132 [Acinetobacter phage Phab24]
MKITVKETIKKIDVESKVVGLKGLTCDNLLDVDVNRMLYAYSPKPEVVLKFLIHDEDIGYVEFKVKPHESYQHANVEKLISDLKGLFKG